MSCTLKPFVEPCPGCIDPTCWDWANDAQGRPVKVSYCKQAVEPEAPEEQQEGEKQEGEDGQNDEETKKQEAAKAKKGK